ncbi:molecular chaperone [Pantoea vagans]|uniref:fimbrial biogenesis chaperone n=1 Tax=Pantoea vagans TaxID=470934 RepID=UPI003B02529F
MFLKEKIKKTACLCVCFLSFNAYSSVVMQGTRVIFNPKQDVKSLKFTNTDPFPYITQVWTSKESDAVFNNKKEAPFVISPGVFKINAKEDHLVNMLYTGGKTQSDREELFYLHFTQIPGVSSSNKNENKIVLAVTNTMKIFLRPDNLKISSEKMFDYINFSYETKSCDIFLKNNSPYYLNSTSGEITAGPSYYTISKIPMVAPFSDQKVRTTCLKDSAALSLKLNYVNDYGVINSKVINKK